MALSTLSIATLRRCGGSARKAFRNSLSINSQNRVSRYLAALSITFTIAVHAEDTNIIPLLKLSTGQTLTNAHFSTITPADAIILYDGGGTRIPLEQLPDPLKRKYYDPHKAKVYTEQIAKQKQAADAWRNRNLQERYKADNFVVADGKFFPKTSVISINGEIDQILKEKGGLTLRPYVSKTGTSYGGGLSSVGAYGGGTYTYKEPGNKVVFVSGEFTNQVDGQKITIRCVPSGTITLYDVNGDTHTFEHYSEIKPYIPQ